MLCYVLLVLLSFYVYGTLESNFNKFDATVNIFNSLNMLLHYCLHKLSFELQQNAIELGSIINYHRASSFRV
jgi:hypothetical protein